jgi:hypothetical protein
MVRHPDTGRYRRTHLFVLTLGYSRKAMRRLVWQSSAQVWAELHERALRRLGGTVRVIVLDNLKLLPDNPAPNEIVGALDGMSLTLGGVRLPACRSILGPRFPTAG